MATSRETAGNLIWELLERYPGGLTSKMVCHYLGLGLSEFRSGIDWIRDLFQEERERPIFWIRSNREVLWKLRDAINQADQREYAIRRKRGQLTAARRDEKHWNSEAAYDPSIGNRKMAASARALREQIEFTLEDLEGGSEAA